MRRHARPLTRHAPRAHPSRAKRQRRSRRRGRARQHAAPAIRCTASAPSTSAPPPTTDGAGASRAPSQAQATPKTTSSRASSEISGAAQHPRRAPPPSGREWRAGPRPAGASSATSCSVACIGQASGKREPRPTAGRRSAPPAACPAPGRRGGRVRCCSSVQLTAAATGTHSATAVPSRWRGSPVPTWRHTSRRCRTPASDDGQPGAPRQPVAEGHPRHQRGEQRRHGHGDQHVGHVVSVSATMKAVNITAQQTPDTHSARPPVRSVRHSAAGPRIQPRIRTSARASEGAAPEGDLEARRALSSWRVTTPAMLHISAAATIIQTARRCVMPVHLVAVKQPRATPACARAPSGGACGCGCSWA